MSKKGFTLIEMLIVFLIIVLIISIILISLSSFRKNSQDKRIASEMDQLRKGAQMYKNEVGSYNFLSCSTSNDNIDKVCADIDVLNGSSAAPLFTVSTDNSQYCAYVTVASSTSRWYCVDSDGKSAETTTDPSTTGCTTVANPVCL